MRQLGAGIAESLLIGLSLLGVFWLDGQKLSATAGLWVMAGLLLASITSLVAACRYLSRLQQRTIKQ